MDMGKLFRIYIDESGDHHYHDSCDTICDEASSRYLGLIGILFEVRAYREASIDLENLKQKCFKYDPDYPIIFHRTDIINKRGPFSILRYPDKAEEFNAQLMEFLNKTQFLIIIVVIDKKAHYEKYHKAAFHPYHYALTAMLERYCGYLNFRNSRGDVMAERRGGVEDRSLMKAYSYIYINGTYYRQSSFFQRALTSKEIKIKPKTANILGLQIADLLAHPCKQELLFEKGRIERPINVFGTDLCKCIKHKYNVQIYTGKVEGYGKIFLG